mgnify:CR=1 FL=1
MANANAPEALKNLNQQKIGTFEEALNKIMAAIGINDADLLINQFIKAEEKNFALFKFVNELNLEIENYETQILEMQSEIDRNLQEGGLDSQKHRLIKDLEKKLTFIKAQIDLMEKDQNQNIEKIK